jgi:transcriptional regulator with XRE-family HTH domain
MRFTPGMPLIKDKLKELLSSKKLSTRKLAALTGGKVSHGTIHNILKSSINEVDTETIYAILVALEVPTEKYGEYLIPDKSVNTSDSDLLQENTKVQFLLNFIAGDLERVGKIIGESRLRTFLLEQSKISAQRELDASAKAEMPERRRKRA